MNQTTNTQRLQGRETGPATPMDTFPKEIRTNGHELSIEEHYRIARMPIGVVRRRYAVRNAEQFVADVKAAIRFWDGVKL